MTSSNLGLQWQVQPAARFILIDSRINLQKSGIFNRMKTADGVVNPTLDNPYRARFWYGADFTEQEAVDSLTNAFAGITFSLPECDPTWAELKVNTAPCSRFISIAARRDLTEVFNRLSVAHGISSGKLDNRYYARFWYGTAFSEEEALAALELAWSGADSDEPMLGWESVVVQTSPGSRFIKIFSRVDLSTTKLFKKLVKIEGITSGDLDDRYTARFWYGALFNEEEVLAKMKTVYSKVIG